jgi:lysyl-tRNA synthetase class I
MSNQTFKKQIPNENFFSLLDNICSKTEKYYIINNDAYKRGVFTNNITAFLEECKPFYHLSKQKYLERKLTYNNFTTVLRQICNFNKIIYTSQIKYDKSSYNIIYHIYHASI